MKPIMKTKTTSHTPGPWTYDALQKGGGYKKLKTKWIILAPQADDEVATVRCGGDIGEANACLISAAPDLLEACKSAIYGANTKGQGGTLTAYDVDLLRAAIAKAEGK